MYKALIWLEMAMRGLKPSIYSEYYRYWYEWYRAGNRAVIQ